MYQLDITIIVNSSNQLVNALGTWFIDGYWNQKKTTCSCSNG